MTSWPPRRLYVSDLSVRTSRRVPGPAGKPETGPLPRSSMPTMCTGRRADLATLTRWMTGCDPCGCQSTVPGGMDSHPTASRRTSHPRVRRVPVEAPGLVGDDVAHRLSLRKRSPLTTVYRVSWLCRWPRVTCPGARRTSYTRHSGSSNSWTWSGSSATGTPSVDGKEARRQVMAASLRAGARHRAARRSSPRAYRTRRCGPGRASRAPASRRPADCRWRAGTWPGSARARCG